MFLQQLVNGIMLGSVYSLIAIGYTLVFGVLNLLHLAHGEVFMAGAFIGLYIMLFWKVPFIVGLLGAMAGAGLIGILIELIAVRPLPKGRPLAPLITTIGVAIILQQISSRIFGGEQKVFPESFEIVSYNLGPAAVTNLQLFILANALILMVLLHLLINKTKIGKAMRAVAENTSIARALGVNVSRIISFTFFVASALAGAAGVLVGMIYSAVSPYMGVTMGLKGLVIMLLGGLGNVPGAMVGGLLLGVVEVMSVAYLASSYKDAFSFGVLIFVLLLRPAGLFGLRLHSEGS